ncbi:MAG: hypothetical protein OEN21_19700 [Myxococcales bacterium]|nr:hypothetical protein [Myxococcales bacterium]
MIDLRDLKRPCGSFFAVWRKCLAFDIYDEVALRPFGKVGWLVYVRGSRARGQNFPLSFFHSDLGATASMVSQCSTTFASARRKRS